MSKINYTKLTSLELDIFANKIAAYIREVQEGLAKISTIITVSENGNEEMEIIGSSLHQKSIEAIRLYNDMQKEMESRIKNKLKFNLDYFLMSKKIEKINVQFRLLETKKTPYETSTGPKLVK